MFKLLAVWGINALALIALPYVVPSISVASFGTALWVALVLGLINTCLLYTSPSPRDRTRSRMPSSA